MFSGYIFILIFCQKSLYMKVVFGTTDVPALFKFDSNSYFSVHSPGNGEDEKWKRSLVPSSQEIIRNEEPWKVKYAVKLSVAVVCQKWQGLSSSNPQTIHDNYFLWCESLCRSVIRNWPLCVCVCVCCLTSYSLWLCKFQTLGPLWLWMFEWRHWCAAQMTLCRW